MKRRTQQGNKSLNESSLARGKWIEAFRSVIVWEPVCLPSQEGSGLKRTSSIRHSPCPCLPSQEGSGLKQFFRQSVHVFLRLPSQEGSGLKHVWAKWSAAGDSLPSQEGSGLKHKSKKRCIEVLEVFPRKREVD